MSRRSEANAVSAHEGGLFMKYVYIIQSQPFPQKYYSGISQNPDQRLNEHNQGKCKHTSKFRPWELVVTIKFENEKAAYEFEKYLKSGSGRAFAKRHFW